MGVGFRLKTILRNQNMTIKQLSEKAGVPLNTLYSITKRDSERVDPVILQRIAEALGVSTDELYGLSDAMKTEIEELVEYIRKDTGDRFPEDRIRNHLIECAIDNIPHETFQNAQSAADAETVELFKEVSDTQLLKYYLESYDILNRRGRIEAVLRVSELEENSRFKN